MHRKRWCARRGIRIDLRWPTRSENHHTALWPADTLANEENAMKKLWEGQESQNNHYVHYAILHFVNYIYIYQYILCIHIFCWTLLESNLLENAHASKNLAKGPYATASLSSLWKSSAASAACLHLDQLPNMPPSTWVRNTGHNAQPFLPELNMFPDTVTGDLSFSPQLSFRLQLKDSCGPLIWRGRWSFFTSQIMPIHDLPRVFVSTWPRMWQMRSALSRGSSTSSDVVAKPSQGNIRRFCNLPPSQQKTKFQGIARNVGQLLSILETEAAMNHRLSTSWLENQSLTGFKKHGALRDIICTSIEINRYDIHMSDRYTCLYFCITKGRKQKEIRELKFLPGPKIAW